MSAIIIKDLNKTFGSTVAVNEVSFSVEEGELFGLLGPNGAGKTTIINMLTTLLTPSSGTGIVHGYDIMKQPGEVRRNIGIIFQDPSLDNGLTGRENLDFHAMMYQIDSSERKKRIIEVLDIVGLTDKANHLVETYSGGMKRRLEIARGLIHHPKVLFLDEPTLGLDAQTRRKIWDHIKKLNTDFGMSIILTTHYMEEADYLCDRIAIIDHGNIIALNTPEELKKHLGGDVITLETKGCNSALIAALNNQSWINDITLDIAQLKISIADGDSRIPELIDITRSANVEVTSVSIHKPSLEDVFLHFTGLSIRDEGKDAVHGHGTRTRRVW